jgi:deazaflavin-dependent oxidoreductase (nitroreductase family)
MSEIPDPVVLKGFNAKLVEEFRANGGKVSGPFEGADLLVLTTTGAKSGQPRVSPLAYQRVDGKLLIIGSYRGADIDPAWVHNLRANPQAHIEIGTDSYDVVARELRPDERSPVWAQIVAVAPGFGEYQANTSRVIPVFELTRV